MCGAEGPAHFLDFIVQSRPPDPLQTQFATQFQYTFIKPYKFIGFGDIYGPKPYKFTGFGDIYGPKAYKFIGLPKPGWLLFAGLAGGVDNCKLSPDGHALTWRQIGKPQGFASV